MQDIERDEWARFSVRLQVARRVVGMLLLWGVAFYLLSAVLVFGMRGVISGIVERWYAITPANMEIMALAYLALIKGFMAGVVLPFWLSIHLAGNWVRKKLA